MRIVIAGSSGLIGTALRQEYQRRGHTVTRLVRRPPQAPDEVAWDPAAPDPRLLDGAEVVVNLAGAGIGDRRWTGRYRALIRDSRVVPAQALATMAAAAEPLPRVMLSSSGIRYYGIDRGDETLTEASRGGTEGLLTAVAQDWEEATGPATRAGVAVCHLRLGLVLSRHGGLLPPLLRLFRAGVGGYFGSGREFWSCVSLTDTVRAVTFLSTHPGAAGPYNIAAPGPMRNRELMRELARVTRARALVRVPIPVLRVVLGGIAAEVFGGLRVSPQRLAAAGFEYQHPHAAAALRDALA